MPSSSTVPSFKAALVAALQARAGLAGVQVAYRWPGPETLPEGVYLGDVEGTGGIASLKAGRQHRQEAYTVSVICQTFSAAATPVDQDDSEARAFALMAEVEGALADDPKVSSTVDWSEAIGFTCESVPFEHGWATRISVAVRANARLT